MKTTFTREELQTIQIALQGEFELAVKKVLLNLFGPEMKAHGTSAGFLRHDLFRSNDKAALNAVCHAVDVVAAVIDSPELRPIMAPIRADLKALKWSQTA